MPQYNTVTLTDGQATPVNHDFTVQSVKPDLLVLSKKLPGVPFIGWPEVVVRHRPPVHQQGRKTSSGVFREEFTLKIPQMDITSPSTASGVQPQPTVAYVNQVKITYLISERATETQKRDLRRMMQTLFNSASAIGQIENSEGIWA